MSLPQTEQGVEETSVAQEVAPAITAKKEKTKKPPKPRSPVFQYALSISSTVFNITKIMMGAPFLSLPYAAAKSGFAYVLVLILVNAIFNCYTGLSLNKIFNFITTEASAKASEEQKKSDRNSAEVELQTSKVNTEVTASAHSSAEASLKPLVVPPEEQKEEATAQPEGTEVQQDEQVRASKIEEVETIVSETQVSPQVMPESATTAELVEQVAPAPAIDQSGNVDSTADVAATPLDSSSTNQPQKKQNVAHNPEEHLTYQKAMKKAFGIIGEILASLVVIAAGVGACAAYFIVSGEALHDSISSTIQPIFYILMLVAVCLPFVWVPNVNKLGFLGSIGFIIFAAIILVVVIFGLANPEFSHNQLFNSKSPALTQTWNTGWVFTSTASFVIGFGVVKFCYCGHEVFLLLRSDLEGDAKRVKNPERHPKFGNKAYNAAVYISVALVCLLAMVMTIGGYFLYGGNPSLPVQEYIMANFPKEHVLTRIVKILVAVILTATVPVTIFAPCEVVEGFLSFLLSKIFRRKLNVTRNCITRCILRTFMVACSVGVAFGVPNFAKVVSVVGAVCDSLLGLVMPCMMNLRLFWRKIYWYEKIFNLLILLFGLYGVVSGILLVILL